MAGDSRRGAGGRGAGAVRASTRRMLGRGLARLRTFRQSLRFRLSLGLIVALGITFTLFILIHYEGHRRRTLHEAEENLGNISSIIEGSLEHAMLTRDSGELQQIMDNLARQRNIRALVLLDSLGDVRFAPGGKGGGTNLELAQPVAPGGNLAPRVTTVFTNVQGEPVLRLFEPIPNKPACQACHDPKSPAAGALLTDFSLAETDAHLRAELWTNLLVGLVVLIVAATIVNLFLNRLVLGRLDRMMGTIRRFGASDRSQRMRVQGDDEMSHLATAFNEMAAGLQAKEEETERLCRELEQKEEVRLQLLHQVIRVQEEERKRLARELHDDFAQTLTALTLGVETAVQRLPAAMESCREQLAAIRDLTSLTLGQTHRWIQDLRPLVLDDLGLVPAVRWYAQTRLEGAGLEVQVEAHGLAERLPSEVETTLFRVVQEAINNVAKHAHARHVSVILENAAGRTLAEVTDDGTGFDPQAFLTVDDDMRGAGLLGMRERVALVGGQFRVTSRPGDGTTIRIEVPWTR